MARIRSIKPEFWTDEKLAECSIAARLLFIGMWNFADDEGRMEYSPKRLKMQIFPSDSMEVEPLVQELARVHVVQLYAGGQQTYLSIPNFKKHQRVDRPRASVYPVPPDSSSIRRGSDEDSASARDTSRGLATEGKGMEGKGMEEERGARGAPTLPREKRSFKMPEDFRPNDQHRDMASKLGIDLEEAFAKFRDYHGSKGNTFKDWNQALNNWLRNELKFNRGGNNDANGNRARQRKADNLAAGRVVIRDLGLAG